MDDLISRRAAIDDFDGVKVDEENCTEYDIGFNDGIDLAISKLSVLPSAQPERKKGLWMVETETDIKSGRNAISGYKCNKCGYFVPWDFTHKSPFFIDEYNFCPHCGVDTRREKHEAN